MMLLNLDLLKIWLNRLSGWLLLWAVGWLCWGLAKLFWLIIAPPLAPKLPVVPRQAPSNVSQDYSSAFTIFANPPAPTSKVAQEPLPDVKLKGVMLAIPASNSSALLAVDNVVKNYRIGSQLQGSSYKLIAVDWNQVIIANSANQQTVIQLLEPIDLNQSIKTNNGSGTVSNRRLPTINSLSAPKAVNPVFGDDIYEDIDTDELDDSDGLQSALSYAVNELKENPANYLNKLGVMATGNGYEVSEAMPTEIQDRLGLESGDKVISVNGQQIGSNFEQDAKLLQQIQQTGEASIQVQRGQQIITIRQQF